MATITQNVASLQYVRVRVTAIVGGNTSYDPTGDAVSMGFGPPSLPNTAPVTWYAGTWETDTVNSVPQYIARCLVGPGGVATLAVGLYLVWLKITDNPEIPVLNVGKLQILGG